MKLKELIGDSHELGYDTNGPAPILTANEDCGRVVFIDDLHFHRTHHADLLEELGIEDGDWMGMPPATKHIMSNIIEHQGGLALGSVSIDTDPGGEGSLEYSMTLPVEALEMDVDSEELFDLCWDFLATCVNVTDPGTFGSPYIITEAARILEILSSHNSRMTEPVEAKA